jgi:hypothetical protein
VQDLDEAAAALPQGPTKKQSTLKATFGKQDKSKVDALWGRAFYGNGLSFRLINDPHFKAAVEATADFGENYKLPSLVSFRTTLLDKERYRWQQNSSHLWRQRRAARQPQPRWVVKHSE